MSFLSLSSLDETPSTAIADTTNNAIVNLIFFEPGNREEEERERRKLETLCKKFLAKNVDHCENYHF
jgi:hypothetical protein